MFKFSSLSFKDGELNMGENSCVDRCTSKYWLVSNLILRSVMIICKRIIVQK